MKKKNKESFERFMLLVAVTDRENPLQVTKQDQVSTEERVEGQSLATKEVHDEEEL